MRPSRKHPPRSARVNRHRPAVVAGPEIPDVTGRTSRLQTAISIRVFPELPAVTCGRAVNKPVDNPRQLRINTCVLWTACGQKEIRNNFAGNPCAVPARGSRNTSPSETGTTRRRLRGRERNRETGTSCGYTALAGGPEGRGGRVTDRLGSVSGGRATGHLVRHMEGRETGWPGAMRPR
jgi:hypothetical protein